MLHKLAVSMLLLFIPVLFGCNNRHRDDFISQCYNTEEINYLYFKTMTLNKDEFGILIPKDWEIEKYRSIDNPKSIVGLDTTSLYLNNTVKSITLTKHEGEIDDFKSFFQSSLIAVKTKYELIEYGKVDVKSKLIPWIFIKDEKYYSITFYVNAEELLLINIMVSPDSNYLDNLCLLSKYVITSIKRSKNAAR